MTRTRSVEITKPDKLLWPELGITKAAYAAYLSAVADDLVPWLRERPLTLVRAPDGVGGKRYFQKDTPSHAPPWIPTVTIASPSAGRDVRYTVCNDAHTLRWLGNQAALEFHPAPVRRDRLDRPDLLVVDIDPPDGAFDAAVAVASLVVETLVDLGLDPLVKTTGGKGLHVVVPVERRSTAEGFRRAATALGRIVTARDPGLMTDEFRKDKRGGRVMLDPSRNGPGATFVAVYSPRLHPGGTVSFPVDSNDLGSIVPGGFTLGTALDRLSGAGPRAWRRAAAARPRRLPAVLLHPR